MRAWYICPSREPEKQLGGGLVISLLSICIRDSTDGEFLVSSGRLFQMRVVEGRDEVYCWDLAGIVRRFISLRRLYRLILPTIRGTSEERHSGAKELIIL